MAMTIATTVGMLDDAKLALSDLVIDLQRENMRLKRLVSELLLRNQQLRSDS